MTLFSIFRDATIAAPFYARRPKLNPTAVQPFA
jgi:hypothetical protein